MCHGPNCTARLDRLPHLLSHFSDTLHRYEAPHLTLRLSHPSPLPLQSQVPLPAAPPLAAPPAWILVQVGPPVGPLHVAPLPAALRVCLAPLPQGCLWLA
jgi:hypothetical protein